MIVLKITHLWMQVQRRGHLLTKADSTIRRQSQMWHSDALLSMLQIRSIPVI